jgi:hypothetical protein
VNFACVLDSDQIHKGKLVVASPLKVVAELLNDLSCILKKAITKVLVTPATRDVAGSVMRSEPERKCVQDIVNLAFSYRSAADEHRFQTGYAPSHRCIGMIVVGVGHEGSRR